MHGWEQGANLPPCLLPQERDRQFLKNVLAVSRFLRKFAIEVELTGVEPVSALGISTSLIHRLSFSNPQAGTALYPGQWDALVKS